MTEIKRGFKKFWNWMWHSESIWSYVVFLILLFIVVKYIFLPGLSLAFGMGFSGLPMAIVESSSMDHNSLVGTEQECLTNTENKYGICGNCFSKSESFNLDSYWKTCGSWYESRNITKEQFSKFSLKNGFHKGDIIIIFGRKIENIKIGDVIIFKAVGPTPIIHRVIALNPLQTKGDHNSRQIIDSRLADESNINPNQIIGVAVARIPYLGWVKLAIVELYKKIF